MLQAGSLDNEWAWATLGGMAQPMTPIKPEEMLKARLNQPRVSWEYLCQQMERHRQASEEFSKDVRSGTLKPGAESTGDGGTL